MEAAARGMVRAAAEAEAIPVDRARGATIQVLIGPNEGAPRFFTRRFTIQPGGRIPEHRHAAVEHEQVVLEGEMVLSLDGVERVVKAGDAIFIPAGVAHWYENRSVVPTSFLCVVPKTEEYQTEWLEEAATLAKGT
jgi:quercetin dioxygenase-like cupin family protein